MHETNYSHQAGRYAQRSVVGTDSLVFRELESRIRSLELAGAAIDVGCGSGRSARFLQSLGLETTGLDVSEAMIEKARQFDPVGTYASYLAEASFPFADNTFDVLVSTWAILEISTFAGLTHFLKESGRVLRPEGVGMIAANTAEFYSHRWVSCEVDFPENKAPLRSGQAVKARLMPENVVVCDTYWAIEDYCQAIAAAGLQLVEMRFPLAPKHESGGWLNETDAAPFVIFEIEKRRI